MTTTTLNLEKATKKFNDSFRKLKQYQRNSYDKMRVSKPDEESVLKVLFGSGSYYCELRYIIKNDTLIVKRFDSREGGMMGYFCPYRAQIGINYLFGLSEAVSAETLIIERIYYRGEDNEVFSKAGFLHYYEDNLNGLKIDFEQGRFFKKRNKFLQVEAALKAYKEINVQFKYKFVAYDLDAYIYEIYLNGLKGIFSINSKKDETCFSESTLNYKMDVLLKTDQDTTAQELHAFFSELNEQSKLQVLLEPSDEIFNEVVQRELRIKKPEHKKVLFDYVANHYDQEEIDRRSLEKDMMFREENVDFINRVRLYCIFDLYVLEELNTETEKNSFVFYEKDKKEEAKNKFKEAAFSNYKKYLNASLNDL